MKHIKSGCPILAARRYRNNPNPKAARVGIPIADAKSFVPEDRLRPTNTATYAFGISV
jgi:hypothetical protein